MLHRLLGGGGSLIRQQAIVSQEVRGARNRVAKQPSSRFASNNDSSLSQQVKLDTAEQSHSLQKGESPFQEYMVSASESKSANFKRTGQLHSSKKFNERQAAASQHNFASMSPDRRGKNQTATNQFNISMNTQIIPPP